MQKCNPTRHYQKLYLLSKNNCFKIDSISMMTSFFDKMDCHHLRSFSVFKCSTITLKTYTFIQAGRKEIFLVILYSVLTKDQPDTCKVMMWAMDDMTVMMTVCFQIVIIIDEILMMSLFHVEI